MNAVETTSIVAYMAEAWPWAELGEHTAEVWADSCPQIEHRVAAQAMRRLVKSEDRPPSVARFLTECRLIARENAQPVIAAGPMHHSTKAEAAAKMAGLRNYWREASAGRPPHKGCAAGTCARCTTTDEFLSEHSNAIAAWLRDFRLEPTS